MLLMSYSSTCIVTNHKIENTKYQKPEKKKHNITINLLQS